MPKSGWTNKMVSDLRKCAEMAKEKENKDVGLLFCSVLEAEWRHLYPRSKFDRHFLLRKYDNLEGNDIARPVEKTFQNEGKQNGQNHVEMAETGNDQEVNFAWTLKRLEDLEKCKENALKTQDEMKKRFNAKMSYMKVMHKEWLKLYPNSTHSANSLQSRLWLYQKQKKVSQNRKKATEELVHTNEHSEDEEEVKQSAGKTIWTPEMLHDLEKCYNEALKIQEDSKKNDSCVSYMTVMLAEWNKLYPESTLSAKNLHARLWIYQKEKSSTCKHESGDSNHDEVNTKKKATDPYEGDLKDETKPTLKDLAAPLFFPKGGDDKTPKKTWLPEHANMPQDQGMLYSMRVFGQRHAAKPLFDGICYNCGMMLFGRVSEGHKFLVRKDALGTDQAPVVSLYDDPPTLSFEKSEVQWYSCKLCSKGLRQLLPCVDPETGLQKVPKEVGNLKSPYERGQVSLCGLFSTTLKRADPFRKIWPHFSGEVNILHKLNRHYYGMYGFLVAKEKPVKEEGSHQRIAAALKWLRCNNPLYANFFSNYETLYRFRPDNPLSVAFAHGVRDAKGGSLEEQLGQETAALVVPFSEDRNAPQIHECEDVAGIQHPERKNPQDVTNAEREILSTTKVTYLDPNLEAKAWPHLFPYGTGSWAYGLGLTPTEYCKLRLLNYGNRWRKDPQWAFFWFDRLTKSRIFYYNRARKARRTGRDKPLTSEKIKGESPYDVYGTEVPNTIPGSKGYWSSRLLDVLAMSRELGKPDFFVTLTQNDAWPELQAHITRGAGETAEGLEFDESLPEHMSQDPAMEFPTETVVAFQKRFQLFREKVLEDANGPLGRVNDYWWRIEYQRRGALHVHMVVWCEPDTIPEDAVIAEFPRSEDVDDQFTQACRSYVQKYQIHGKCVPERCFKGPGGKVLDHCKYGFPFGVEENDRPDESGMRMLYQRRCKEDSRVVPYNLPILLLMGAHVNIQRVTSGGWELYLAKYVAKAEPSFDMKLPEQTSDPERYLRTRVVGRLEVENNLLGFNICRSSRTIIYLPTTVKPDYGFLKRKQHLPEDPSSTDVFYDTLFDKYLDRPDELQDVLYPDYVRRYMIGMTQATRIPRDRVACGGDNESTDDDTSSDEEEPEAVPTKAKCNETRKRGRPKGIRSCETPSKRSKDTSGQARGTSSRKKEVPLIDKKRRAIKKRKAGKEAIPRWQFFIPTGEQQEKYYEQKLLLNVPLTREDILSIFSENNLSKTFLEECAIRGFLDETKDGMNTLQEANSRGFSMEQLQTLAQTLVDCNMISSEACENFLGEVSESRPKLEQEVEVTEADVVNEDGNMADMAPKVEQLDLAAMVETLTPSQRKVYEWVSEKLSKGEHVQACIVGPAGTGKSYLLKAIVERIKQVENIPVAKLATTGVAAVVVGGTTVHNFFRMDINCQSYLEKGTLEHKIVRDTAVLIIDEFSMLEFNVFLAMDRITRQASIPKKRGSPFGGKHVILIGDPAQLPAIDKDIYDSWLWQNFDILMLKEVKRQEDPAFASMLNKVRFGIVDEEVKWALTSRMVGSDHEIDLSNGCIIVALRCERDYWNDKFLQDMEGEEHVFDAIDTDGNGNPLSATDQEKVKKYHRERLPDKLVLKVGARVVLLKNIDVKNKWVNGTMATVERILGDCVFIRHMKEGTLLPLSRFRQNLTHRAGTATTVRQQFPLVLGWAVTVHKVQGMEPKQVYVLMNDNFFASGQAYVALSRVKRLEDLHLLEFDPHAIYLADRQRILLQWMESVDLCTDRGSAGSSRPPMPKLPEQTFLNKKQKLVKSTKSTTAPRKTTMSKCPKLPKEFEVKQNEGRHGTIHSSRMHSLASQLLVDPRDTTPTNVHVANAKQVLKTAGTNQSIMYSMVDSIRTMEPVTFSEGRNRFSQDLDEHIHPVLSYWYRLTETPPDGNCLWHMISLDLCGTTELMPILRMVTAFILVQNEDYFQHLMAQNEHDDLHFDEQVAIALRLGAWGGEMHLHALSIALHRPIYVYTTFLKPDGLDLYLSSADSEDLEDHFRNRVRGTTQHLLYTPPGEHGEIPGRDPICGMFLDHHYTAMLPQSTEPDRFVPTSNIASGGNRYLLSAYFRRPVLNIASVAQRHEE